MPNPSFEEGSGNAPKVWQPRNYAGQATATWVEGGRTGALAEYVCARADRAIALKPANMTFEQTGSVAVAAITAGGMPWRAAISIARLRPGEP